MRSLVIILSLALILTFIPTASAMGGGGPGDRKDPPPHGGLQPPKDQGEVLILKTEVLNLYIVKDKAHVGFGYPDERGSSFHLHFGKVIGYNDSDDPGFQVDEMLYFSPLDGGWQMSPLIKDENETLGPFQSFTLTKPIDMQRAGPGPKEKVTNWANLTLHFLLASYDFEQTVGSTTYEILGGAELKIDIELDIHKALMVDSIAIEQRLFDQPFEPGQAPYTMDLREDDRHQRLDKGFNDTFQHTFKDHPDGHQHLGLLNSNELEESFYNWVSEAELTTNGTTGLQNVTTTYHTTGEHLNLYLSYPYTEQTSSIFHDPSVGVVADNLIQLAEEAAREFIDLLISYGLGLGLAVGVIGVAAYVGGRQSKDIEL